MVNDSPGMTVSTSAFRFKVNGVSLRVGVGEAVSVAVVDGVPVASAVIVEVPVASTVVDGVSVDVPVSVAVAVADGEGVGVPVPVGVGDKVGVGVPVLCCCQLGCSTACGRFVPIESDSDSGIATNPVNNKSYTPSSMAC